jgi:hypothetical protein
MASTYSTSLRIQLIGNGEQAGVWGSTTNTNLGTLVEQAITGVQSISIAGLTTYSLSSLNGISDQSRNAVLVFTGALTASCAITAPAVNKTYVIYNNTDGGYAITIKTASGTAVSIGYKATSYVYCNATDFFIASIGPYSPAFTGVPTAPTAAAGTNTTQIATTAFVGTAITNLQGAVAITGGTITGTTISGTAVTANSISNTAGWAVTPSGTTLYFAYNGTNVAKLDSSGNLTAKAAITSYGTI